LTCYCDATAGKVRKYDQLICDGELTLCRAGDEYDDHQFIIIIVECTLADGS